VAGVVALMLQAHPELTPDQVKFRLMYSARPALTSQGDLVYNVKK
jgi:subtilisin family serine protease